MRLVAYARMACSVCVVATSLGSASLSAQTAEGRLERDGAEIFYRDIGSGPPLLLLHGFFRTGELWDPFVDELSASNRLIVPDMRGHGRSTNPSQVFLHRDSAADILALLDHLYQRGHVLYLRIWNSQVLYAAFLWNGAPPLPIPTS